MAYAQADLVAEVLADLFKLEAGESATTEDTTAVTARVEATLAELAALNIYYLSDATDIPPSAFNALVAYMVEVLAPKYGRQRNPEAKAEAEAKLRTLSRIGKGTGKRLSIDPALKRVRRWGNFTTGGF